MTTSSQRDSLETHKRIAMLVLVRHGESLWNVENRFTGWRNPDLSEKGVGEARKAGLDLKSISFQPVHVFCSGLLRTKHTAQIILETLGEQRNIEESQSLNERDYGELSGMNREEAKKQFGQEQVRIWRRSFDVAPPRGESLAQTKARVVSYFQESVLPKLMAGEDVLVVAHGNSLRALIMELENILPEEIEKLNLPTGVPMCYVLGQDKAFRKDNDFLSGASHEASHL